MAERYYVATRPRTNDYHPVHKEGCPFLDDNGEEIYLGLFNSGHEAIKISKLSFARTENCLFCCKEKNIRDKESKTEFTEQLKSQVRSNIPLIYKEEMFCCLN